MSIYIGNLPYQASEEDVTEIFAEYGTVKRVQLPTDRETGRPRGFGFVEMSSDDEETAAIEALDGAEWMGRDLKVNKARPREERPARGDGGWGGGERKRNDRRY
jgi:RNA recognition motif-containing protein